MTIVKLLNYHIPVFIERTLSDKQPHTCTTRIHVAMSSLKSLASRSSCSSGSPSFFGSKTKNFEWVRDFEVRVRTCSVQVISRDVGGSISNSKSSKFGNSGNSGIAKHIALYFDWGDRQAIYEANAVNDKLIPSWINGPLSDSEEKWTVEESYSCECSPKQVNEKAKDLPLSGQHYQLTTANCYWWAYDFAKTLGINIELSDWAVFLNIPGLAMLLNTVQYLSK